VAGSIDATVAGSSSQPVFQGKPVVLVPYYSVIEKECEDGLRALVKAGVALSRFSLSAIDLLRSAMLSHALNDGFDQFLFIDADIGFDPRDAIRLFNRPEPVVAGIYVHNKGRDFAGTFAQGVTKVVFGPAAQGLYPMLYAPTGFLRIRAEVLRRMIDELKLPECHWGSIKRIYPFFLPLCVPDGRGGIRYLTEDYSFSYRLAQIGVTPMADTTIKLFHYKKYGFSYEDLRPRLPASNVTVEISYAEGSDHP
jgi:glycosyltransferase involved in cell wall biosynthesis